MGEFSSVIVIGNPENRRVQMFREAADALGLPEVEVISYESLLAGTETLAEHLQPGALARLESPGENARVERGLVSLGAETDSDRELLESLTEEELYAGRIGSSLLWFRGYAKLLANLKAELRAIPITVMNHPDDVRLMFNKLECQQRMHQASIPVPENFGHITSYEQVREVAEMRGTTRVFVKLMHGSSASGVIALYLAKHRRWAKAVSSVELVHRHGQPMLYNSLRLREYSGERSVSQLIDALAPYGLYAEFWVPKITFQNGPCDLRIVMINGEPRHMVVRIGRGPLTNLHLGNQRGSIAEFIATRVPSPARWEGAMKTVRHVATLFPHTLYFGLDLAANPRFREHYILEVNAYGDLLPHILDRNESTYTAELRAIRSNPEPYSTASWD